MFVLRTKHKEAQGASLSNVVIGDAYSVITHLDKGFKKFAYDRGYTGEEGEKDIDKARIYGFIITNNWPNHPLPLYKYKDYYIMNMDGKTFEKI